MLAHASGQSSVERVCNYDGCLEPRRRALREWQEFVMEQAGPAWRVWGIIFFSWRFLAAYAAVNLEVISIEAEEHFLAAYAAVNEYIIA